MALLSISIFEWHNPKNEW